MKILVVSDLHYSLKQFDWLVAHAAPYDLVIIAGDLMELGSYVEPEVQAAVVERYFQKICERCPLVVCSGNHDLVDEGDGTRSAEWLADLSIPNLFVDFGCYEDEKIRVLSLPWWEGDAESAKVGDWLATQFLPEDTRPVFWVNHAPAKGTKTSWNGKRDLGDQCLVEWIETYSPTLVLTGHVHNAPYYPEGSWIDQIGRTVVTNGGRQTGEIPATIEVEVENGEMIWCGMEGCQRGSFQPV
jgi:Icc-related predicted phosphoesterase